MKLRFNEPNTTEDGKVTSWVSYDFQCDERTFEDLDIFLSRKRKKGILYDPACAFYCDEEAYFFLQDLALKDKDTKISLKEVSKDNPCECHFQGVSIIRGMSNAA